MTIQSAQSVTVLFTTRVFSTGVGTNADSLPTGAVYVNGTANAATVTVTNITTGIYKAAATMPTLAAADAVELVISATVGGVSDKAIVWGDTCDASVIRQEMDTNSTKLAHLDADVSTRLAASAYTAPTTPPTAITIRQEMDTNSTKLDAILADVQALNTGGVDPTALADAVVAGLAGRSVIVQSNFNDDGTELTIVQGDDYAASNGHSLFFTITNQTNLIGAVAHLRFDGETADAATATVTSATQTLVFSDLLAAYTATLPLGSVGYQIRFNKSGLLATLISGQAYVNRGF